MDAQRRTLWAAYASAHIDIQLPGGTWITFVPDPVGAVTGPWPFPDGAVVHVLTAWNPGSRPRGDAENEAAQRRLEARLAAEGCTWLPALGRSPDGSWREPSLAVDGLPPERAVELCRAFDQRARYVLTASRLGVVGCTDTGERWSGWRSSTR